jgi:hypothetical protein
LKRKNKLIIIATLCFISIVSGIIFSKLTQPKEAFATSEVIANDHELSGNALYAKNRNELVVCIENYSSDKTISDDTLNQELTNQIKILKKEPEWKEFSGFNVKLTVGCSFKPYLLQAGATHPIYSGKMDSLPPKVDVPSIELTAVFVVDQSVIDTQFKDAPTRWSPEQYLCNGGACDEITKGIYITPDELNGKGTINFASELKYGVGLADVLNVVNAKNGIQKEQERLSKIKKEKNSNK